MLVALLGLVAAYAIGWKLAGVWGAFGAAGLLASPRPGRCRRRASRRTPRRSRSRSARSRSRSTPVVLVAMGGCGRAGRGSGRGQAAGPPGRRTAGGPARRPPRRGGLPALPPRERSHVWAVLLVAYAGALGELWESVVADHRDARGLGPSVADNIERVLLHPLDWRTPAGVLVPIGLVAAVVLLRRVELLALGAWIGRVRRVPRRAAAAARPPLRPARRHAGGARRCRARRGCHARSGPGALRRRWRRRACDSPSASPRRNAGSGARTAIRRGVTWAAEQLRAANPAGRPRRHRPPHRRVPRRPPGARAARRLVVRPAGHGIADRSGDPRRARPASVRSSSAASSPNRPALISRARRPLPGASQKDGVTIYLAP